MRWITMILCMAALASAAFVLRTPPARTGSAHEPGPRNATSAGEHGPALSLIQPLDSAQNRLPASLPPEALAQETLEVSNLHVLVAGRVLDEAGEPAQHIPVRLLVPGEGGRGWDWSHERQAPTDELGRFEFTNVQNPRVAAVKASVGQLIESAPTTFTPGQRDLVLRLRRNASISGSLEVEPELLGTLAVAAIQGERFKAGRFVGPPGKFVIEPLEAGTYELLVISENERLLVLPDVVVRDGQACADPRLRSIRLPMALHPLELSVVDTAGRPVDELRLTWRVMGDPEAHWVFRTPATCKVRFASKARHHDIAAYAPGYRLEERPAASGRVEVVLRDALQVRLNAPSLPALPDGVRLTAGLRYVGTTSEPGSRASGSTGASFPGTRCSDPVPVHPTAGADLSVARAGVWRVRLELHWAEQGAPRRRVLRSRAGLELVRVLDLPGEQVFEIAVVPEQLNVLLRSLGH